MSAALEDSLQDDSDAYYYAAVIQKHWRGYCARKSLRGMSLGCSQQHKQHQQLENVQEPDAQEKVLCEEAKVQHVQHQAQPGVQCSMQPGVQPDVWNEATGTLIRKRGILQAALASRRQSANQQQDAKLHAWQQFSQRQARRYVPAPPNHSRRMLSQPICYRVRIQSISNLPPLAQANGTSFELQLGVSLLDESIGAFYGNTCYSPPDCHQQQQAAPAASVDFCFDVFFHSAISDPRCMAVVEVIMVERDSAGQSAGQFSVGWAQLPLFADAPRAGQMPCSQPAAAALMRGTPRYLLFRSVCEDELPPPSVVEGCHLTYQAEMYPAMAPVQPLLPEDFIVSYSDVIPGLRRFGTEGQLTTAIKSTISTLASPMLAPGWAVRLAQLQLLVPQVLHNLLSVLPQLAGVLPPPDLPTLLAVPSQPAAVQYTLSVGAHNGRTFVGSQLLLQQLQVQPNLGSLVLRPDSQQLLQLDWVPADDLVVLVLELLATPVGPGAVEQVAPGTGVVLVGRAIILPFAQVAADGNSATLLSGMQQLDLVSSSSSSSTTMCCAANLLGGVTSGMLPVNWRAMLRDTAVRAMPDPAVQVELMGGPMSDVAASTAANAFSLTANHQLMPEPTPEPLCVRPPTTLHQQQQQSASAKAETAQDSAAGPAVATDTVPPPDTRAVRRVRLASQKLAEAASIPVEELPADRVVERPQAWPTASSGRSSLVVDRPDDAHNQQQLQQLADAMQQQIGALAKAVEELKEERQTLRSSLTILESTTAACPESPAHHHIVEQESYGSRQGAQLSLGVHAHRDSSITASELERLKVLNSTSAGVLGADGFAGFSGAHIAGLMGQESRGSKGALQVPSRAVMQQLHEAGMTQALPADVRDVLQRSTAANCQLPTKAPRLHSSMAPLVMDIEARDPRTASDVVLQLLAFRPSSNPAAAARLPAELRSVFFTLQFYNFGPALTEHCLLATGTGKQAYGAGGGATWQQPACVKEGNTTFVLLPAKQCVDGAGLVLKYQVDSSTQAQMPGDKAPAQAAFEGHMAFCKYLSKHNLGVDVWDGDSLLQLGICTVNLQGLLRQGMEFSEQLLEVPLMQASSQAQHRQGAEAAAILSDPVKPAGSAAAVKQSLQLGQLVVRLINIGREPSNAAARLRDFNAVEATGSSTGKKVRVRAVPLQPNSPVAKELTAHHSRSPFSSDRQQQQEQQQQSAEYATAATAADIVSFEQRKVAREQQLRQLLTSPVNSQPGSSQGTANTAHPWPPMQHSTGLGCLSSIYNHSSYSRSSSPGAKQSLFQTGDDTVVPYKALQRQLLADVDAVRKRQKAGFIRSQLSKDLVTTCTVQPSQGQVLLVEHVLVNSLGRDAVFNVKVSHPQELQAIEGIAEYRQLLKAVGQAIATSAAAAVAAAAGDAAAFGTPSLVQLANGVNNNVDAAGQLVNKGRIFLAANERVSIPFKLKLQQQQQQPHVSDSNQETAAQGGLEQPEQPLQHTVTVDFVPMELDYPVNILQLQVQPRPMIVDRTLRYHCPERDVMRVSVPLGDRRSSAAATAAADGSTLIAAASRPDVMVSVSYPLGSQQQRVQQPAAAVAGRFGHPAAADVSNAGEVHIRYKCGASPEVVQFHIWLYGDASMAQPIEVWQVFVHALQKVDMRAVVGQSSSTSLALTGGTSDRQMVCYSSHPDQLQAAPRVLQLPAKAVSALNLNFKPLMPGREWVRIHLVDPSTRQLVHAFIVATEAGLPNITRSFEVELQSGQLAQRQISYTNPYAQPRMFNLSTNMPWLLSFQPSTLELPARASRQLMLLFDGRTVQPGAALQVLAFVNDEGDREEECMEFAVIVM